MICLPLTVAGETSISGNAALHTSNARLTFATGGDILEPASENPMEWFVTRTTNAEVAIASGIGPKEEATMPIAEHL